MWKVVLLLLAVFILGPLVVSYVLKNPLEPTADGNEVVVESQEYVVHFTRSGPLQGTYLVVGADNEDWTAQPVNAILQVVPLAEATDYLRAYPEFHLYGSQSGAQVGTLARPLSVIAGNRPAYSALRGLLDLHQSRSAGHGERLCATFAGDFLQITSAQGLEDDQDHTSSLSHLGEAPIVYAETVAVDDCAKLIAAPH